MTAIPTTAVRPVRDHRLRDVRATRGRRVGLVVVTALSVGLAACGATTDAASDDQTGEVVAGSCLAGDEDCTDESYGGQDVARPVPLADSPLVGEEAIVSPTAGARATPLTGVHEIDATTLQIGFDGDPCTFVEAIEVIESPAEVRLLVLTGRDPSVDACIEPLVSYTTTVRLDEPVGERRLLDLAG